MVDPKQNRPTIEEHVIKEHTTPAYDMESHVQVNCWTQLNTLKRASRKERSREPFLSTCTQRTTPSSIDFWYRNTTQDSTFCRVILNLLFNRRLYVKLINERSRRRKQRNGLPIHNGTRSFIYADDLCITTQYQSFKQVEKKQMKMHWITYQQLSIINRIEYIRSNTMINNIYNNNNTIKIVYWLRIRFITINTPTNT